MLCMKTIFGEFISSFKTDMQCSRTRWAWLWPYRLLLHGSWTIQKRVQWPSGKRESIGQWWQEVVTVTRDPSTTTTTNLKASTPPLWALGANQRNPTTLRFLIKCFGYREVKEALVKKLTQQTTVTIAINKIAIVTVPSQTISDNDRQDRDQVWKRVKYSVQHDPSICI